MDKNFNDQELSDIMKEIEALEDNFQVGTERSTEVIDELIELDQAVAIPQKQPSEVISLESRQPRIVPKLAVAPASMSFKVQGDLNLVLNFEVGSKTVSLEVNEKGLTIQLEGGVTFSVPLADQQKAV